MPRRMVALRSQSYRTRRLQAGDHFEAYPERDATILVAIRKARYADGGERAPLARPPRRVIREAGAVTPPPAPAPMPPATQAPVEAPTPPAEPVAVTPAPAPAAAPAPPVAPAAPAVQTPAPAADLAPDPVPATAPATTRAAKGRGAQPE